MSGAYNSVGYVPQPTHNERLSDIEKLSAHVTRILGQNPGLMTLQGTNSYLLQPPSNNKAPLILIDTSSPHTSTQYVDLILSHLHHLALESGVRETHFESMSAQQALEKLPEAQREQAIADTIAARLENPQIDPLGLVEYGGEIGQWSINVVDPQERKLPTIEHIIITHRHLDHVGAIGHLLEVLKENGCPPPKIWKFPNPDEVDLTASPNASDRLTSDAALVNSLTPGTYIPFSPFQPIHPVMPGLMISIIDPKFRHLLKYDAGGKPKWNEVPEIARVSVRCLKTPGHTADSISLVLCEGEKGVFAGDTVLGQGTTVFTDLTSYMTSLKTLSALKPNVLYPGHGPHIPTPQEVQIHIQGYITHRQQREDQIATILKAALDPAKTTQALKEVMLKIEADKFAAAKYNEEFMTGVPMKIKTSTAEQEAAKKAKKGSDEAKLEVKSKALGLAIITRLIYKTGDEKMLFAAKKSIKAHLEKLVVDGKVEMKKGKGVVGMPLIVESEVQEPEKVDEAWQWVE